ERAAGHADVERLDAELITRQVEHAPIAIPESEDEDAGEPRHGGADAPRVHRRENHLGIGVATPGGRLAGFLQLAAKLLVVVDLAVVADLIAAGGGAHRLVAAGGDVNDGETAMGEADSRG